MTPFTVNIAKTSASSFSITVMDLGKPSVMATTTTTKIPINKTFHARLDKILKDRMMVFELTRLSSIWRDAYTEFLHLEYKDDVDDDTMLDIYGTWYTNAVEAVHLSYAIKYYKTILPPCDLCGHTVTDFRVVSEFVDQGEYLKDASISSQCRKCFVRSTFLQLH